LTLADLKRGQQGVITDVSSVHIPLKLLEMGCLPGNSVELVQVAPFADPMVITLALPLKKKKAFANYQEV